MGAEEILRLRLANHHLAAPRLEDPAALVAWFGAVQAQDYAGATWALGQRLVGATAGTVARALDAGRIVRTHLLRPTWHLVAAEDLRWLLALTAPRVRAAIASADRGLGLDAAFVARAEDVIARALEGGRHRTRGELAAALGEAGVAVADSRTLAHLVLRAELDALVCSGPRRGKEQTYALVDERVPGGRALEGDEALAELAFRYVASHGPATLRDFVWWSGLTVSHARRALGLNAGRLVESTVDGLDYWLVPADPPPMPGTLFLLPNYDEYTVAYQDRDLLRGPAHAALERRRVAPREDSLLNNVLVRGGRVVGTWRRPARGAPEVAWAEPPDAAARAALAGALERHAAFHAAPAPPGSC